MVVVKCQKSIFFFCVKIVFMNPYFSLAGILTIINPHRFSSSTLKKYKFLSGLIICDFSFWKKKSFFEWFYYLGFSILLYFFFKLVFWVVLLYGFFSTLCICYLGWLVFFFEGTWCCCCCWVVEFGVEECDSNSNKSMEIMFKF